MSFQHTKCNICGSSEFEIRYYQIRSGVLVRCSECDLYYANPRKADSIQKVLNNNTSKELYKSKMMNYYGRMREFEFYLKYISKYSLSPGKILDVGCYEGYFLYEARKYGWDCYGVEPNIGGANYAKEWLKLNVKQCVLEKAEYLDNSYDVITLFAVLEHLPDPFNTLKEIHRIINKNGLLLISVPVIPFYIGLSRSKWRMFIGDHYYFFTDKSMKKLLIKAGFELINDCYVSKSVDFDTITERLADDWQPNNLGKLGKFVRYTLFNSKILKNILKIRFTINLFDSKLYLARVKNNNI